jgi:N-methylhydantoinase B
VQRGDVLIYDTAGGGGWKNPLDRPVESVQADVRRKLVSVEKARSDYGVVLSPETLEVDTAATNQLRKRIRQDRGEIGKFTFGPIPQAIGVQRRD